MSRTAGDVLADAIRTRAEAVLRAHGGVRDDVPDAVHDCRVAVRRLRSTLRAFSACVAPEEGTLDALTWWVRTLGAARDAEVQRDGLAGLAQDLARDRVPAAPQVRSGLVLLDGGLRARHAAARDAVTEALGSARSRDLTARLSVLADAPPLTGRAREAAAAELRPGVEHEVARVRRRTGPVASWAGPDDGPRPTPEAVHRLRKAARRARYAAEVLASSGDRAATRWAGDVVIRYRELQDLLGEVHDADVLRATLARLSGPGTEDAVDACVELGTRQAERALTQAAVLAG